MLVRSNAVDMVVIDSVAALTPKAEIEGEMGDQLPGLQARLMSQALRKLTGNIKRSNCMVIFINQLRMKIGVMMPGQSPETTTGGNALKFYASVRLDIRRIGAIKKGDEIIGNQTRIKVVKNKLAPPFKQVITEILYGEGISREGELIDMGVDAKLVEKSGAWYSCVRRAHRPGQGERPPVPEGQPRGRGPPGSRAAREVRPDRSAVATTRREEDGRLTDGASGCTMASRAAWHESRSDDSHRRAQAPASRNAAAGADARRSGRLGLLVRREHSRKELTRKLTSRGLDAGEADGRRRAAGRARAGRTTPASPKAWSAAAPAAATGRSVSGPNWPRMAWTARPSPQAMDSLEGDWAADRPRPGPPPLRRRPSQRPGRAPQGRRFAAAPRLRWRQRPRRDPIGPRRLTTVLAPALRAAGLMTRRRPPLLLT